jgi:hypothetical protein
MRSWHIQGFATTRSRVQRFQKTFGTSQLSAITPLLVDEYLSKPTTERKPASVNKESQLLPHMFKKAMEWG